MEEYREIVFATFIAIVFILLYLGLHYVVVAKPVVKKAKKVVKKVIPKAPSKTPLTYAPNVPPPKPVKDLSAGEQVQYIVQKYFSEPEALKKSATTVGQDGYINSLPKDSNCPDDYNDCPTWASNGECTINPEFMLYKCKSSCESCKLNPQQLYNVSAIYNTREPTGCAYHGYSYPDPLAYRFDVLNY